jgi:hypothetical protein
MRSLCATVRFSAGFSTAYSTHISSTVCMEPDTVKIMFIQ